MPTVELTEAEMREAQAPQFETVEDLAAYVRRLIERPHDYGTCVYAMSLAATSAFNLVAHKLGVTGFQASCADMDILRRTRSWTGPAMVIDLSNHLYPQYDLPARVQEAIDKNAQWYGDEARKLLAGKDAASPSVVAHWKRLSKAAPPILSKVKGSDNG